MILEKQELQALIDMIEKTSLKRLNQISEESKTFKTVELLMIGDSMIEYINDKNFFNDLTVVNRGIAGATTDLIVNNFDLIVNNIFPENIIISIGSNNLVLNQEIPQVVAVKILNLLEMIEIKFPNSKIYYLSTTPVIEESNKVYKRLYVAGRTNNENQKINEIVNYQSKNKHFSFINQYDLLVNECGYLDETLTPDGIHLNSKGYTIYCENIKKHL